MLAVAAHFSKFCLHKNYILVKRCVVYMRKYPIYMNFECIFTENDFPCEFILSLLPCPCDGYYISECKEKNRFAFLCAFQRMKGATNNKKKEFQQRERVCAKRRQTQIRQNYTETVALARGWLLLAAVYHSLGIFGSRLRFVVAGVALQNPRRWSICGCVYG